MTDAPSRLQLARDRLTFAALGAAAFGAVEAARGLVASSLALGAGTQLTLAVVGAVSAAGIGLAAGLLLLPMPAQPRGRARWAALLAGGVAAWAVWLFVELFTDPPPFQEPPPLHGSPLAWLALTGGAGVLAWGLHRSSHGLRNVTAAALTLALAGGVWAWTAGDRSSGELSPAPEGSPNVLFVTLDTTRADHMGAYGNATVDTRWFDSVATEGVLFTNASAVAAVTGPSHAAMLTGTGPWVNGVLLNGIPLPEEHKLLSERLRGRGWATGAFVSAYVLDGALGFSRGFDVYDDDFGPFPGLGSLLVPRAVTMAHRHADPDWILERRGEETVSRANGWIAAQNRPWFAWVHLFDAHGPYLPPPPWDTQYYAGDPRDPAHTSMSAVEGIASYLLPSLSGITDLNYVVAQYDGEISYADTQLGKLLAAIPDNTLVAVIGDHGESLGEHGIWFNHGDDVYEASVHVPFAMKWAGHIAPGVVSHPVEGTDVAPTILNLLDLPTEGMSGVDALTGGRSLASSMCFDRDTNLAERKAKRITKPQWRLGALRSESARWVHREIDGRGELFEIAADPTGVADVAPRWAADPVLAEQLGNLRSTTTALFQADSSLSAQELSAADRAKLEALGYLEPLAPESEPALEKE